MRWTIVAKIVGEEILYPVHDAVAALSTRRESDPTSFGRTSEVIPAQFVKFKT